MFETVTSCDQYARLLAEESALLVYYSTEECQVCHVLKPKVGEMLAESFPKMKALYVNLNQAPEVAAQNRIFTVPTVVVLFDGHEYFRKSRSFGVEELRNEISRPYQLMFS